MSLSVYAQYRGLEEPTESYAMRFSWLQYSEESPIVLPSVVYSRLENRQGLLHHTRLPNRVPGSYKGLIIIVVGVVLLLKTDSVNDCRSSRKLHPITGSNPLPQSRIHRKIRV